MKKCDSLSKNLTFTLPKRRSKLLRSLWKVVLASFVSCTMFPAVSVKLRSWACSVIITINHLPSPQVSYGAKVNCMFALRLLVASSMKQRQPRLDNWHTLRRGLERSIYIDLLPKHSNKPIWCAFSRVFTVFRFLLNSVSVSRIPYIIVVCHLQAVCESFQFRLRSICLFR